MGDLVKTEQILFSGLQSEFCKLTNILREKEPSKMKSKFLKQILLVNTKILELENMVRDIRVESSEIDFDLEEYSKDEKVLDFFKPYIIFYRNMLNNS
tara:strand:- start:555 stop:848 length:294 start_codon:yes stop_codon:yes gene_type:complete